MRKLNFEKVKENVRAHISEVIGQALLPCASVLVYQENQGFFSDFAKNPKGTPKNKQNIKKTATIRGVFENV